MGKIYHKQMESINLQIFESVIFSQDANPSLISHNSITRVIIFKTEFWNFFSEILLFWHKE